MSLEIINTPLSLNIYGFSGVAVNKDYIGTAFKLMDKMWQIVSLAGRVLPGFKAWNRDTAWDGTSWG